jgi:Nitroreductase
MENQVLDCILSRRSVRSFKQEQISNGELNSILQAAVWAPSGSNNQSWLFTAVQDPGVLDRLNAQLRRGFLDWQPGERESPAKLGAKKRAENEDAHFFYHAPTLVIASNVPDYPNAMADCSCALQNMFLAAHSLGVGSCWINQFTWLNGCAPLREYLATLGVPQEQVVCGAAAFGYRNGEAPKAPARRENTVRIIR